MRVTRATVDREMIGRRIIAVRIASNMTRARLAEKSCRSEQTIAAIEYGKKGMSIDTLCSICDALSVTPNYVLGFSRYPADKDEEYSRVCDEMAEMLKTCNHSQMRTAEKIIKAFIDGVKRD